ncbi:hypothetical protein [Vibrio sp. H11]|uniref:hypothetical protein n=1 Tax=Vibrio sp. H11 TaxID=2565928 RepID=UPI0010A6314D|nr:hypothetical protein [Vibrio sp. H11]
MNQKVTIINRDDLVVDYFFSNEDSKGLVVTFTERTNRELSGSGFGGEVLLENNYDLIAIKTSKDIWYENLSINDIDTIKSFLKRIKNSYSLIASYGSSMGAYGSIKFAKAFFVDRVIAISPLFNIKNDWEHRWDTDIPFMNSSEMIVDTDLCDSIEYHFFYDPYDKDAIHIDSYRKLMGVNLNEYKIKFAGHPVSYCLRDMGLLKMVLISLLDGLNFPTKKLNVPKKKQQSVSYLFWFSEYLIKRCKFNSAFIVNNRLLAINSENSEYHMQKAKILNGLNLLEESIIACDLAIKINPNNPHFGYYKDLVLNKIDSTK